MGHGIASMLLVALGGALGGMGRYAVSNLMAHLLGKTFPWGTFTGECQRCVYSGRTSWLLRRANHTAAVAIYCCRLARWLHHRFFI